MTDTLAAVINVGPGSAEAARLEDTVDSLLHHEPRTAALVVVDDEPGDGRDLAARLASRPSAAATSVRIVAIENPRDGRGDGWSGGLCAGTLAALRRLRLDGAASVVVKLDCDSLVIAPFHERIAAALRADAGLGMLGAYDLTYGGFVRDWEPWAAPVRRRARPLRLSRRAPFLRHAIAGAPARVRADIRAALRHGYRPGEHCLGGGYALSPRLLERLGAAGILDDPLRWLDAGCGEDVMLGVLNRACGLRARSMTRPGEPFAIGYKHLPDEPERLLAQGHAIVHSVAATATRDEAAIRAYFRARRAG